MSRGAKRLIETGRAQMPSNGSILGPLVLQPAVRRLVRELLTQHGLVEPAADAEFAGLGDSVPDFHAMARGTSHTATRLAILQSLSGWFGWYIAIRNTGPAAVMRQPSTASRTQPVPSMSGWATRRRITHLGRASSEAVER
jgi:hypothetical protein